MEDWTRRALARWPNVPALFGWLGLDRRGRWLIQGEVISRPQIIDTINRNYAADEHGRWYFQNGPQRGYIQLEAAPLVLRSDGAEALLTHTGLVVERPSAAYLDEEGALLLMTEHGPGALLDADLDWALQRLETVDGRPPDEAALATALALSSGETSALSLRFDAPLKLLRLDRANAPERLNFVRDPQLRDDERSNARA